MKKQYYLKDVVTLSLNEDKCIGCGMCEAVCPHAVFAMNERKVLIVDRDACMECGACAQNCPVDAIGVMAGVGCAAAVIQGYIAGTGPCCGPTDNSCNSAKNCC
jgi:NAD-dependent dihydropyrimidine dehydrogenase PreA subunit